MDILYRERAQGPRDSRVVGEVVRVASGVRLYVMVEVDPPGGERGRGCHIAAVTKNHRPHSAGII